MAETNFNLNATTAEKIAEFEAQNRISFPREFVELLHAFSGKKYPKNVINGWLSLEKIIETIDFWHDFLRNSFGERWSKVRVGHFHHPESVVTSLYNPKWIPFLKLNNVLWCMDFNPRSHGKKGQVIRVDLSSDPNQYHIRLENPSFSDWFKQKTNSGNSAYAIDAPNTSESISETKEEKGFNPPFRKEIKEHIQRYIGNIKQIFSEPPSNYEPVELLHAVYAPDSKDSFNAIITCGMATEAIPSNQELKQDIPHYVELMVLLPADWPIGIGVFADFRNYWPVHWLRLLSKMAREYERWPMGGQTFTNGKKAPIADTNYGGVLLFPPLASLPEEFALMETPDGGVLHFYTLIPLTAEELTFKEDKGLNELLREIRARTTEGKIDFMDRILDSRISWLSSPEKNIKQVEMKDPDKVFVLGENSQKPKITKQKSLKAYSKDLSLDGLNSKIDELIKKKLASDEAKRKEKNSSKQEENKVNSFIDLSNAKKQ